MSQADIQMLIIGLPVLIFSLVVHEVWHALAAERLGDNTARRLGRVTLNPLPHLDPLMSLVLPALCIISGAPIFGGAKPVPVNMNNLRSPMRDMAIVAAAGPLSNIVLALLAGILVRVLATIGLLGPELAQIGYMFIQINLLLAAFNLLPIPPLDGSRIVAALLKGEARYAYMRLEAYGLMILMLVIFLARPVLYAYLSFTMSLLGTLTGTSKLFF